MNLKKSIALFLTTILTFLLLTSCGNNPGSTSNTTTGGGVTLEIFIWNDQEPYIRAVIDEYKKEHDINFNLTTVPADGEEYDNKLTVMLSGNANIDIMGIKGNAQITQYRQTESLLELTDLIQSSSLDVSKYGTMFSDITEDGNYYALPMRSTCWVLFYNPDHFDELDLEYPGQMTWPEYAELAKKLTKGDGADKQWGGYWVAWPSVLNFFALQNNSYLIDDDLSILQENLEQFNQFYNVDESHMSVAEMSSTNSNWLSEFENGNVSMFPNGEWVVSSLMQDAAEGKTDVNWEIAPMPVPEGISPNTTVGSMEFMSVNANSKYPDQSYNFLQYLCGEPGAEIYANMGVIPAYSSDNTATAFQNTVKKDSASVFFEAKKIPSELSDANYKELANIFAEHAELYLIGEKSIEETMENFAKQRESVLNK